MAFSGTTLLKVCRDVENCLCVVANDGLINGCCDAAAAVNRVVVNRERRVASDAVVLIIFFLFCACNR